MRLSIIIPIFNEDEVLDALYTRLNAVVNGLNVNTEVIFVNDGSSDQTMAHLTRLSREDDRIRVLELSRNFGHQIAITAGLDYANGDAAVVMDGDLQDPPELIPQMLALFEQGYDVVYAKRRQRHGESIFKVKRYC